MELSEFVIIRFSIAPKHTMRLVLFMTSVEALSPMKIVNGLSYCRSMHTSASRCAVSCSTAFAGCSNGKSTLASTLALAAVSSSPCSASVKPELSGLTPMAPSALKTIQSTMWRAVQAGRVMAPQSRLYSSRKLS